MALPDVLTFEQAGLKAWPGLEVDWDGGWVRRAANGYTKRANSLQCFDAADGADAAARLAAGVAWFSERNLRPVVRTTPLQNPALTAELDAAGWASIDHSHLFAMHLRAHAADAGTRVTPVPDPAFLAAQQALQNYGDDTMSRLRTLLGALVVPAAGIVVYRDGAAVASGLMAVADGIVITGNVITDPTRRRQGLGAAMMHTGLAWARQAGASIAALNVQADNPAGKALYASLGFARQYDYTYRVPVAA